VGRLGLRRRRRTGRFDRPGFQVRADHRLVGYSPSARIVIVVIYLREGLIGVNAWRANPTQARRYWEEEDRA
jgi:hypothetical protein